jgi:hypothetical protein
MNDHRDGRGNIKIGDGLAATCLSKARFDVRLVNFVVFAGGEEDGQPAVGNFGGKLDVLRADGRQVDGNVGLGFQGALERLAQAGSPLALVRNLVNLAVVLYGGFTLEDGPTISTYSRERVSGRP